MAVGRPPKARPSDNSREKSVSILETDVPLAQAITRMEGNIGNIQTDISALKEKDKLIEANINGMAERFSASMTQQGERFAMAMQVQSEKFADTVKEIHETFIRKEDFSFFRKLLTAAMFGICAYAWKCLQNGQVISP